MVAQFGTRGAEVRPYGVFFVEPPAGEALEVWRPLLHPFGPATLLEAVTGLLRDFVKPGERIGFDEAGLPPELAAHLQAESGPVRFSPASALIRRIRAVKTPEEVRRLQVAAEVAEAAVADALAAAREGVTEWELAVRFNASVLRRGAWPGFAVVASGERSAYPNAVPSQDVRLRPGDIIRFDVGCVYQGYCSDISRTAVFGEPPPRLAERFQAVAAGERAALARCRPGVRAGEVFEAAVQATREGGIPGYRRHHVGHGIGLEYYDLPLLSPGREEELEVGMVLEVETPYYELGFGGLQVEDTVLVSPYGPVPITRPQAELLVAGA
jgi:Xaa-Pro aminopeptidase